MTRDVMAWRRLITAAGAYGWSAALSPRGRLRLDKQGAVLFSPGPGAGAEEHDATLQRLIALERLAARCRP